jgi:hypothetical protein
MGPLQIVLLVLGILAFQLVMFIVALRWLRRANAQRLGALRSELAATGERALLGPEPGVYRGASSGSGYPRTRGNGVVALTERRLIVRKLVGAPVEVPVAEIAGVRTDKWFQGGWAGGQAHVIVKTRAGAELGLFVQDTDAWARALQGLAGRGADVHQNMFL